MTGIKLIWTRTITGKKRFIFSWSRAKTIKNLLSIETLIHKDVLTDASVVLLRNFKSYDSEN